MFSVLRFESVIHEFDPWFNFRATKYLVEHGCGPPREVRITQAELASAIGASRQRVNVCLQEFQRNGWITLTPKTIRLEDPGALRLAGDT